MLYAIRRNINITVFFLIKFKNLKEKERKYCLEKCTFKNAVKVFLRPEIHTEKKKYKPLAEVSGIKNTDFYGRFVF